MQFIWHGTCLPWKTQITDRPCSSYRWGICLPWRTQITQIVNNNLTCPTWAFFSCVNPDFFFCRSPSSDENGHAGPGPSPVRRSEQKVQRHEGDYFTCYCTSSSSYIAMKCYLWWCMIQSIFYDTLVHNPSNNYEYYFVGSENHPDNLNEQGGKRFLSKFYGWNSISFFKQHESFVTYSRLLWKVAEYWPLTSCVLLVFFPGEQKNLSEDCCSLDPGDRDGCGTVAPFDVLQKSWPET